MYIQQKYPSYTPTIKKKHTKKLNERNKIKNNFTIAIKTIRLTFHRNKQY